MVADEAIYLTYKRVGKSTNKQVRLILLNVRHLGCDYVIVITVVVVVVVAIVAIDAVKHLSSKDCNKCFHIPD